MTFWLLLGAVQHPEMPAHYRSAAFKLTTRHKVRFSIVCRVRPIKLIAIFDVKLIGAKLRVANLNDRVFGWGWVSR